jgi:HD-GYP domain-containing protein (c-di-GMP phosphodiesterase class II)
MSQGADEVAHHLEKKSDTKRQILQILKDDKRGLNKAMMSSGISSLLDKLIDDILSEPWAVMHLCDMRSTGNGLFKHSVNVAIMSLCIGKKYGYSYDEMKQLGIGALNYDIGMLVVPEEIREKETDLSSDEQKVMREHVTFGYLLLSQNPTIPPTSSAVALMHHEHQDGTGYPRGLKGENRPPVKDLSGNTSLHRFAEIVAVADSFDIFLNGRRHYGERHDHRMAMQMLIERKGSVLNNEVVKTLSSIIPIYPLGTRIRIVAAPVQELVGYCGVVAKVDAANLECPQVLLYETRNRQKVKPVLIDMAKVKGFELELMI